MSMVARAGATEGDVRTSSDGRLGLRFTGHPLADVGVATLCAMAGRANPDAVTLEDLDRVTGELQGHYFSGSMQSYLTCVFMNSEYVQHGAGEAKAKKRSEYANRVLRAYRRSAADAEEEARGLRCAYSGAPATHVVHRSQVPMLTGAEVLNFFPAARGALPVAGPYLTAIQAVPMGGRRAEGRLLIAHSDDPALTIAFSRKYLADNRRLLNLARSGGLPARNGPDPALDREHAAKASGDDETPGGAKYPDAKGPQSLVVADLLDLAGERLALSHEASVTVYVMSNSGQGPSLEIHPIPSNLVRFLHLVVRAETNAPWRRLVAGAWRDPAGRDDATGRETAARRKKTKKPKAVAGAGVGAGGPGRSRNVVLEDLVAIFDAGFVDLRAARRFARRHLLRDVRWRDTQSTGDGIDSGSVDWSLTELFLKEVIGMDAKRVQRIREFADKLAEHVSATTDTRLFRDVVFGQRPWEVRNALTKAQRNEAREHARLLFGLQEYLDVFEADDAVGLGDWSLTRDLVSIRLVEALHERGFFRERPDALTHDDGGDDGHERR